MDKYAAAAFIIGLWFLCTWVIALDRPYGTYRRFRNELKARQTDRQIKKKLPDKFEIMDLVEAGEKREQADRYQ